MSSVGKVKLPIVAILTMDDDQGNFRGNRDNFADIINTGKKMGYIVYLVTVRDLNLQMKHIIGHFCHDNIWKKGWFPLPHVIYNRIPQREDESLPAVRRQIKKLLNHPSICLFNPYFFNKWKLFGWLKKSKVTKKYIPSTIRLKHPASLKKMLHKYSYLFLKPESGKTGVGIMTLNVNNKEDLKFQLTVQNKKKSQSHKCATISRLWERIDKEAGTANYIIQQGIMLSASNQRPFDLRALIQKNGRGQWDITGIGARVAGTTSITTNVPRGGSIEDPGKLLTVIFGEEQSERIMARARHAALTIARQIEHQSGHLHGEMSMDLGVDLNGNVWFFEANAKPMKFDEPHIRQLSLRRIFQYCHYLAKQNGCRWGDSECI